MKKIKDHFGDNDNMVLKPLVDSDVKVSVLSESQLMLHISYTAS